MGDVPLGENTAVELELDTVSTGASGTAWFLVGDDAIRGLRGADGWCAGHGVGFGTRGGEGGHGRYASCGG